MSHKLDTKALLEDFIKAKVEMKTKKFFKMLCEQQDILKELTQTLNFLSEEVQKSHKILKRLEKMANPKRKRRKRREHNHYIS
jgi:hypothetical protein